MMKQAMLHEPRRYKKLHCNLCSQHCRIVNKKFGFCDMSENIHGDLYTHAHGKTAAPHVDTVGEKASFLCVAEE